jgi:hypothetical protein
MRYPQANEVLAMASAKEPESLQPGWLRLPRRRVLRVELAGGKLEVATGCIWLTLAGEQRDFFLGVGQGMVLPRGADAVIESTGGDDAILNWRPEPVPAAASVRLLRRRSALATA